jgi:acyl carrier protein
MSEQILEELLVFLCRNFIVEKNEINFDESLIDQGIIDSFGLVEIASFMEREYGITIKEEEMNRDNFGSVLKIVGFIERKRAQ